MLAQAIVSVSDQHWTVLLIRNPPVLVPCFQQTSKTIKKVTQGQKPGRGKAFHIQRGRKRISLHCKTVLVFFSVIFYSLKLEDDIVRQV